MEKINAYTDEDSIGCGVVNEERELVGIIIGTQRDKFGSFRFSANGIGKGYPAFPGWV